MYKKCIIFSYVVVTCYYSRVIIHIEFFFVVVVFVSCLKTLAKFMPRTFFCFTCSCRTACSAVTFAKQTFVCVWTEKNKKKSHHRTKIIIIIIMNE